MQQISPQNLKTPITSGRYDFLRSEIARWQEEDILNRAQSNEILSRYSVDNKCQNGFLALVVTGACLLGAGVLLFISTNWHGVSNELKGAAALLGMLLSYVAAWKLKDKSPVKSVLSESLLLIGCVLYGATTILLAQHFQITGRMPEIQLWAVGIAPIIILFRSHPATLLCAALMMYRTLSPANSGWSASLDPLLILCNVVALYCSYVTRSQLAAFLSLVSLAFSLSACQSHPDEFALLLSGIGCFILHLWHAHSKRWQVMATPCVLASFGLVMVALLALLNEYSCDQIVQRISTQRLQIEVLVTLLALSSLVKSPAGKTKWALISGFLCIGTALLYVVCTAGDSKLYTQSAYFVVNLFYLFYLASTSENRLIQFIPVATLTSYALFFIAAAPGGALLSSGIAFGVGLVLMICAYAALTKSMMPVAERYLK